MQLAQPRPFTRIDALILLATLATGAIWLVESRALLEIFAASESFWLRQALHPLAAFFAPMTLALLILRFRTPRPRLALCLRQPGTAACLIATMFLSLEVLNHFLDLTMRFGDIILLANSGGCYSSGRRIPGVSLLGSIAFSLGVTPGLAVAGALLALASAGKWRPESSPIDRAGRALGWFWIALALAFAMVPLWET
jgi:hypothetical protein